MQQLEQMPDAVRQVLETVEPVRAAGARARRREVGAVPRPPRRLPGRARGRAQAQGAGLHARRGVRRRRAQARPDRAGRGGHAGLRGRAAQGRAACCTTRWSATSRRSGPAARARSCWPRRATRRCEPYADELIALPTVPDAAAAAGRDRAAAGVLVRDGDRARPRRRPAAQPGQVGHGRVVDRGSSGGRDRGRGHRRGRHRPLRRRRSSARRRCAPRLFTELELHAADGLAGRPVRGQGGAWRRRWGRRPGCTGSMPRCTPTSRGARRCGMTGTVAARAAELGVVVHPRLAVARRRDCVGRRRAGALDCVRVAHSVDQVRAAEAALMATLPPGTLMQRAATGLAVACADFLGASTAPGS